jgi:hypothetical protein
MAQSPYEIIVAPFDVWVAPSGSTFPDLAATPTSPWVKIGSNGSENYDEAGVTVTHSQTVDQIRTLGATGPVKAVRSSEDLIIAFTLFDLLLADYTRVMNNASVSTTAAGSGTAGYKDIDLLRGLDVAVVALVAKAAASPDGATWSMQYQVPKVYASGSPAPVFAKNAAAGLAFEYTAIMDLTATAGEEFGKLLTQNANAT